MRLFGIIDEALDRHDRAGLLTPPFDLAFSAPAEPPELPETFVPARMDVGGARIGARMEVAAFVPARLDTTAQISARADR